MSEEKNPKLVKKANEVTEVSKIEKVENVKEETVTVPLKEWNDVLRAVSDMNRQNASSRPLSLNDRVKERTVRLRMIDEKYVIGLEKNKFGQVVMEGAKNELGDKDFIVTLILADEDGKVSTKKAFYLMDLLREAPSFSFPIVEIIDNSYVRETGVTERVETPEGAWDGIKTGIEVFLEDVVQQLAYKIDIGNGVIVEVDEQFVNM